MLQCFAQLIIQWGRVHYGVSYVHAVCWSHHQLYSATVLMLDFKICMTCLQPAVAKRGRTLLYSLILQQNCQPHEPLAVTLATRCLFPGFLPLRLLPCAGLYRCRCRFFPWVAATAFRHD